MQVLHTLLCLPFFALHITAESRFVTLHDESKGKNVTLAYTNECTSLDEKWAGKVSSVVTNGQCVTFYSERNCSGQYAYIPANSRGPTSLKELGVNIEARSFKRCDSITIYEDSYFKADNISLMYADDCVSFSHEWQKKVSSVKVHGQCVILFSKPNCIGAHVYVPSTDEMWLGSVNFNDIAASFRRCHSIALFQNSVFGQQEETVMYKDKCVELDEKWINNVGSVNTYGQCVIFYNQPNCSGQYAYINPSSQEQSSSEEVYVYIEAHSFKRCDTITLYEDAFRTGDRVLLTYMDDCVSFDREWRNRVSSVETDGQCVILFSKPDCTGTHMYLHSRHRGWLGKNFDDKVASCRKCDSITMYEQTDIQGDGVSLMYTNECVRLGPELLNRVSSVDAHGKCIILYRQPDCSGAYEYVYGSSPVPISPDKVSSLRRCDSITLFQNASFNEQSETVPYMDKCVELDKKWINKINSVNTFGQCVTFFNESGCSGQNAFIPASSRGASSLEGVGVNIEARSFKRCHSITLYEDAYFEGDDTSMMYADDCVSLNNEWLKRVSSIETHGHCVILYNETQCVGAHVNLVSRYQSWLGALHFNDVAASFRKCDPIKIL